MKSMYQSKDMDDDGFELKFEDDITKEEKKYFVRAYPNVNMIADRRVHCTSCDGHIGTAPASGKVLRVHPILRVTQCRRCEQIYNSGDFDVNEDGREHSCRWCAKRTEVLCCSSCTYAFCKKCILRNFSHTILQGIRRNPIWNCFACAPELILPLRAQYWALSNFFEKQQLMIERQANAGRCYTEIMHALKHDSSTCCPHLVKANKIRASQRIAINLGGSSSDSEEEERIILRRNRKRQRIESSESNSNDSTQMRKSSQPVSTRLKISDADDSNSVELINEQSTATPGSSTAALPIMIESVRSENPAYRNESPLDVTTTHTHTFLVSVTTSSNEPIFHTINGHRIELNTAAQENSVRLSDGKIIHVRKISTVPSAAIGQQVSTISQPIQNRQEFGQQITQYQSFASVDSSLALQQLTMQSSGSWLEPRKYADGPMGDACTQFERQIYNGLEISRTTDGKLKTLMNSNAYKTVRNVNDVKELLIHMSYLLSYTLGRFKELQDSCINDLRKLGFQNEADTLAAGKVIKKYGSDSDANEVEIVETKHTTIDLDDSDDEGNSSERLTTTTSSTHTSIANKDPVAPKFTQIEAKRESTAGDVLCDSNVVVIVLPQGISNDPIALLPTSQPSHAVGVDVDIVTIDSKLKIENTPINDKADTNISNLLEEDENDG